MSESIHANPKMLSSWKPRISSEDIPFFHCSSCGKTVMGINSESPAHYTGGSRDPMLVLPYMNWESPGSCCGKEMERLAPKSLSDLPDSISAEYEITGGFGDNLLRFEWKSPEEDHPDWVALKSFTGMQLKYLLPQQTPHFVFALTETDSYAYCAESPCLECIFHCKRGNTLYAHSSKHGIVAIPIHENKPR
ncbi:MAG: hypothetical protein ACOYD7_05605 [Raoultibacter sp.]